jgi:hypothetical protein
MWLYYLPTLYWQVISGGLGPDWHRRRTFSKTLPPIAA